MDTMALGLPGLSVQPGTHLCGFFRGEQERNTMVMPFLREGIDHGHKCLCVLDETDADAVALLVEKEVDLPAQEGQLELGLSHDTYLGRGPFETEKMVDFWHTWAEAGIQDPRYSFLRIAGEMTGTISDLLGDQLIEYESELNRFVPRYPQVVFCLYDLDHFSGQQLIDVMRTHPKIVMGGTILENLYYVEPDEFLASRR
jgi:hypothetical protein